MSRPHLILLIVIPLLCTSRASAGGMGYATTTGSAYEDSPTFVGQQFTGTPGHVSSLNITNLGLPDVQGLLYALSGLESGSKLNLHAAVEVSPSSTGSIPTQGDVHAEARWQDTAALIPGEKVINENTLRFTYTIDGTILRTQGAFGDVNLSVGANDKLGGGNAAVLVGGGYNSYPSTVKVNISSSGSTQNTQISGYVDVDVPFVAGSPITFTADLHVDASAEGLNSMCNVDFSHTISLSSITFVHPDGTEVAPESEGYQISFASGMLSPNVLPAPEPNTITLVGLAGAIFASYGQRRRNWS